MKLTIEEIGYVEKLRQRLGLEKYDTSKDSVLENLDPFDRVKMLAGWYIGDEAWAETFVEWMESQGLYITTNPDDENVIFVR